MSSIIYIMEFYLLCMILFYNNYIFIIIIFFQPLCGSQSAEMTCFLRSLSLVLYYTGRKVRKNISLRSAANLYTCQHYMIQKFSDTFFDFLFSMHFLLHVSTKFYVQVLFLTSIQYFNDGCHLTICLLQLVCYLNSRNKTIKQTNDKKCDKIKGTLGQLPGYYSR